MMISPHKTPALAKLAMLLLFAIAFVVILETTSVSAQELGNTIMSPFGIAGQTSTSESGSDGDTFVDPDSVDTGVDVFDEDEEYLFSSNYISPSWVPQYTADIGNSNHSAWGSLLSSWIIGDDSFHEFDISGAIGRGRIVNPKYRFTIQKVDTGILFTDIQYVVKSIDFQCEIEDLYDFNYCDSTLSSHAAAHQIAYGNGYNGRQTGMIYRHKIKINTTYFNPFEEAFYPLLSTQSTIQPNNMGE